MKMRQTDYINSVFTEEYYEPINGRLLVSCLHTISRSLIRDAAKSKEVDLISKTFMLAIEDFVLEYGALSNEGRRSYDRHKVLFLLGSFLDKLDTLSRLGFLVEGTAVKKFVYAVEVFKNRSIKSNESLDSLG